MSTTSCPRCTGQVTLPLGVKNDATVRCPLCHAHYTLADALVNMPPILEVVENADEALPADSFEEQPQDRAARRSLKPKRSKPSRSISKTHPLNRSTIC